MSYRSFKKALGETNIERKCRVLFGICLGILIVAAFLCVDRIGEKLVKQTAEQIGRDYVGISLVYLHWTFWSREPERDFVVQMGQDLLAQEYESSVLALGEDDVPWKMVENWNPPADDDERKLLVELKKRWTQQMLIEKVEEGEASTSETSPTPASDFGGGEVDRMERVFDTMVIPSEGRYNYYQPVYWSKTCFAGCHDPIPGAYSAAEGVSSLASASHPFRVVKVTLPYQATQRAIARTRAVLIAAAILTIFLAMVAMYVIVRYVIVKPLKHLRDVSDEISRGNSELRADIRTNDEFEELADAFNRMLRHMIEAQGELRNVNVDLDAKVDELAQLNMRLYEMNRLKSDFLANMSHELRTPLNSIIGFSDVLQGIDSLTDKQKRYAQNIQKSGRLLLDMINDILDLAKLEAGKMEVRPAEFRVDVVVHAQCDMVRSLSEEKNIDLDVETPADEEPLFQDQSKVQQILTNLLSNAIKFTPEGGRITVTAERTSDGQLRLSVADTGVGIPDEDSDIIFEKFRQSETVLGEDGLTREYSGTGLGLSIVKELCKLLGGEISFVSELGKGSTFSVTLPWTLRQGANLQSELSRRLDSLARPDPAEFQSIMPAEK
jgi:signal transduction histidine kinase